MGPKKVPPPWAPRLLAAGGSPEAQDGEGVVILTIGHSTRPLLAFIELLQGTNLTYPALPGPEG
jgi:hypothetical protein